jgi:hypothetical protein
LFFNEKDSSLLIGIVLCPDFLGNDFFKRNSIYSVRFSKDKELPKNYRLMNSIKKHNKVT